jgi:hypothetical protein
MKEQNFERREFEKIEEKFGIFFRRKAYYIGNSMCKYNVTRRMIME